MSEAKDGCAAPAQGPIVSAGEGSGSEGIRSANGGGTAPEGGRMNQARAGRPAPDFEATAFEKGGFRNIRLSEFAGRWVVLCFYPGDFTFV